MRTPSIPRKQSDPLAEEASPTVRVDLGLTDDEAKSFLRDLDAKAEAIEDRRRRTRGE
jgi:hypothetical protein